MKWWLAIAGMAALIIGFWPWTTAPSTTLPLPSAIELSELLELNHDAQVAWLTHWQEVASRRLTKMDGSRQANASDGSVQALLVRGHPPVVVVNTLEEGTSSEGTLGWQLPWPIVVKALRTFPAAPVELAGSYQGIPFTHTLIPVDPQAQLVLVATHASQLSSQTILWRITMSFIAFGCFWLAKKHHD